MSVIATLGSAGNARATASLARSDSGLFVGLLSVVSEPPSSPAIATTAATTATIHAPIARHGCRALAIATEWVESLNAARTRCPACPEDGLRAADSHRRRRRSGRRSRHT